ncbi:MAG: bifunctional 4-hydroxy-3-methylbut-2-enyl diphosphate reductase/30S ribosomal protein S1 [Clostridiales bacterium]|nr:bifunctional 4-hydroxy-3-methylbut-2-enyl diphosphate reductase/30S ribosomal protein S1 [Clostridiales bacterium]
MRVLLANNSGFCFGVRRAVEMAERCALERGIVYTYGNIIHNESVVAELGEKGVHSVDELDRLKEGDTLIIRAHGAPPTVYEVCQSRCVRLVDATCPYVKRIHQIVEKAAQEGRTVLIAGKANHPEVVGIRGWAGENAFVLESDADAARLPKIERATLVSQTTLPVATLDAIIRALKTGENGPVKLEIRNTICDTTRARQSEAEEISRRADRMLVLGSKSSANTQKLVEICKKHCKNTVNVESSDKLFLDILSSDDIIGIVAGASTPDRMIREVLQVMSEQEKTTIETIEAEAPAEEVVVPQADQTTEEPAAAVETPETTAQAPEAAVETPEAAAEVSEPAAEAPAAAEAAEEKVEEKVEEKPDHEDSSDFAAAFEKTMTRIHNGQIIEGTVISIVDGEVFVNIGYKSDGVIPASELSGDSDVKAEDLFKEGDTIEVEVTKVNDGDGNVLLSRKNVESKKLWDELLNQEDIEEKIFDAVGKEVVKGGIIADISGIRAFVPASHVSTKYIENLSEFVGKPMRLKVLEVDRQRKRIVASQKQVLLAEAAVERRKKWESLVVGSKVTGVVRRIADFGAFVDIGGIDGLVHVTDAAWGRVKHPSDVFSIGEEIEVLILNVDVEKERVSLGYKQLQPKPWMLAGEKYQVGSIVEGKVVRIVPFGAFVALESTIDGLIHISQVSVHRIAKVEDELKVGDVVRCKVLEVSPEAKRISLSRKEALLEEDPELAEQVRAEKAERDRQYAERQEQRQQQRDSQQAQQRERRDSTPRAASSDRPAGDRSDRGDRRRRNNEDGDYELPPVQEATTSLASLFEGLKVDDDK